MMRQTSHCGIVLPECAAGMVYIRFVLAETMTGARRDQPAGLNLPRFRWKAGDMTERGGIPEDYGPDRGARSARPALALAIAGLMALALPNPSRAQFFSDRPPPVPPSSIPDASPGGAISLAPPSGPASAPNLPAPLTQPPVSAVTPPVAPPPIASTPGQAVLSLTARYGKDLPVINGGLR